MEELKIENQPQPEAITKQQLEQELELAKEKYEKVAAQAPDFFNQDMLEVYREAYYDVAPELRNIYIKSKNLDPKKVLENFENYKNFNENHLKIANDKIREIKKKILVIDTTIKQEESLEKEIEEEAKFKLEKEGLVSTLYAELDKIYAQIPQEATDSGMTTQNAIKHYLPNLTYKVEWIESYINRLDDINHPISLERFRRELERDNLLKINN
jgi:hypothetical protein